jgi:hypothetical protein
MVSVLLLLLPLLLAYTRLIAVSVPVLLFSRPSDIHS